MPQDPATVQGQATQCVKLEDMRFKEIYQYVKHPWWNSFRVLWKFGIWDWNRTYKRVRIIPENDLVPEGWKITGLLYTTDKHPLRYQFKNGHFVKVSVPIS